MDEERRKRAESSSLLNAGGAWRMPGYTTALLPTPLSRPNSAAVSARAWSARPGTAAFKASSSIKVINEATLFDETEVLRNAQANALSVEQRALQRDARGGPQLHPDQGPKQPKRTASSRPGSAMSQRPSSSLSLHMDMRPTHTPPCIPEEDSRGGWDEPQLTQTQPPPRHTSLPPSGASARLPRPSTAASKRDRGSPRTPGPGETPRFGPSSATIGQSRPSTASKSRPTSAMVHPPAGAWRRPSTDGAHTSRSSPSPSPAFTHTSGHTTANFSSLSARLPSTTTTQPNGGARGDAATYGRRGDGEEEEDKETLMSTRARPQSAPRWLARPLSPLSKSWTVPRPFSAALDGPPYGTPQRPLSGRRSPQHQQQQEVGTPRPSGLMAYEVASQDVSIMNKRLGMTGSPPRPISAFSMYNATAKGMTTPTIIHNSVADQPVYNDESGEIRTADDVVYYFTQAGHLAQKKLFYLNGPHATSPYDITNPFDLTVVPAEKVDQEYFTMSVKGIVHVEEGGQAGDFTTMSEWMRLCSMFGILRKMRFFRLFLVIRSFGKWHRYCRRMHFNRVRDAIRRKLFLAIKTFQPALSKAMALTASIRDTSVGLFSTRTDRLYSLEEFVTEQDLTRDRVALPALTAIVQQITDCVSEMTATVEMEKEKLKTMTDLDALRRDGFSSVRQDGGKSKSITELRSEREECLSTYMRWMEEAEMLPLFVRLVDFMVAEAYVFLAVKTVRDLLNFFENPAKIRGIFTINVAYEEPSGYAFTPLREEIQYGVVHTMDSALRMVHELPRPLSSKSLVSRYLDDNVNVMNVFSVTLGLPQFVKLREECIKHIGNSYVKAAEYVFSTFEDKRVIHNAHGEWQGAAEYAAATTKLAAFRRDMQQHRRWGRQVETMKMSSVIGVLFVDSKKMRSTLQETSTQILEEMRGVLSVAARQNCATVLEQSRATVKQLDARHEGLDAYTHLHQLHLDTERHKEEVFADCANVFDMYDLYKDYHGKLDIKEQVSLEDLAEVLAAFKKSLVEVEAWLELRRADNVADLGNASQALNDDVVKLLDDVSSGALDSAENDVEDMMSMLVALEERLIETEERAQRYNDYQKVLNERIEDYGNIQHCRRDFDRRKTVWTTMSNWLDRTNTWMNSAVETVNAEEVLALVDETHKSVFKMCKAWRDDMVIVKVREMVDDFKQFLPLFQEVCNPALQPHHWAQVFDVLGLSADEQAARADEPITILDLSTWGALSKLEAVGAISSAASKEASLRRGLAKMQEEWATMEFHIAAYKDTGASVVGHTDDIQMLLDDQLMKVQAMNASPFVKPFKAAAVAWEKTLVALQELLDQWVQCQATWMYLEPIFSSEDIVKQMPEEGAKFLRVNSQFRSLMEEVAYKPAVIPLASDAERLESLRESNKLLEEVQRGLAAYLEKKRLFFPRFFFLSNDEMLEILSETKDPTRVQPHLRKCFEGIDRLQFEAGIIVSGIISVEKELVGFKAPINTASAKGAVERWLLEVEERMFEAVHDVTGQAVAAYAVRPRDQWVLQWPGMVVLVASGVYWTRGVEAALTDVGSNGGDAMTTFEAACTSDLMAIVNLVRGELSGLQRATLGALVVMDVHARDVATSLVAEQVTSTSDFSWQAQLRTYWEKPGGKPAANQPDRSLTVKLRMMSSVLEYGYEYLGNSSRLVITPLTDRCYRTLMGAIHMNLGGAPEGPAGTGKTETTKDLAKAMARQCVVFNCSDSLDYLAMGKFFKGLAASGAWACFDEFNRIDLEVLSVVAQQVMDIQRAIAAKLTFFTFEGTEMQLRWSAWCAITMNPGYAGRSELPDNLKALFRTVAMMVPDYAMISEIMLFSCGYLRARECAKKIVQCYTLCSEQLSSQDHYDYGMRAVMAVLRAAGNLKRRFPSQDEFVLMLRSIMDVNLCKFLGHDVPLFQGIISDLFPGVVLPESDYKLMHAAIQDVCSATSLQPTEYFMLKTTQLYEMIVVRHGLMLVGEPFSGKTCSYRTLAAALTLMAERDQDNQEKATYHVINPKSVTMGQLYGQNDPVSHEWSDGVLAVIFRKCAVDQSPVRKWLVLDGPVDAIWIENMNTVLDDNKKLCLNSGEIIQMSSRMNMIFEVADLAVASPATVSRCGMVYMEPQQLGVRPLFKSWLSTLPGHWPESLRTRLEAMFSSVVMPALRFVRREVKEASPTSDANLTQSLLRLFSSVAMPLMSTPEVYRKLGGDARAQDLVEGIFIFATAWSLGCSAATREGRGSVSDFIRSASLLTLETYRSPTGHQYRPEEGEGSVVLSSSIMGIPQEGDLHDWMYDAPVAAWRRWEEVMAQTHVEIPADAAFGQIIVPTADSASYTFLLKTAVENRHPMLCVGPTGTGKTVNTQRTLLQLDTEVYAAPNFVGFSAQTSANMTQQLVDAKLDKRRKGVYGPPAGRRAVVFVDDLNMPAKETYGAQPPVELLRQLMDHGGWYDRDNSFRTIQDLQLVAAMGPPGGGRTFITARYSRHFHVVGVTECSEASLAHIFGTIQGWFLTSRLFPKDIVDLKDSVVAATIEVYNTVATQLLPTPSKSHYTFNLRDVSRVMQGMQMQGAGPLHTSALDAGANVVGQHVKLWEHELVRVFYDRLVDDTDQKWFLNLLKTMVNKHFRLKFDTLCAHLAGGGSGATVTTTHLRRFIFGDYMLDDASEMELADRPYVEILDPEKAVHRMEEYLDDFNASSKRAMNLAMFLYAVEHVSRIARVLRQEGGHILSVGVGGSGRSSLGRLAAFLCSMETFQVEISRSYGVNEWHEDLKRFCKRAGAENKPCTFLFSDSQIKAELFVEDINNLLNTGEVPNMFPYDERAALGEAVRGLAKKAGRSVDTPSELWAFFIERCRANLHLVLCFSPIGDSFRERLRQFPSLVNCCTIDWFQPWPQDALEAVAHKFLSAVPDLPPAQQQSLMQMCKAIHTHVRDELAQRFWTEAGRRYYVTPTSYLELMSLFTTLLNSKRSEVQAAQQRYFTGLSKLEFTASQVEVMQSELTALKPVLERTVAETENLLSKIEREKLQVVEPKKQIVDKEVQQADKAAGEARAMKEECESILAEAMPALSAAIGALDTIKTADIKLVQSFKNPPAAVKFVMEAVCVMLDIKPTMVADPMVPGKKVADYWDVSKKVLMDSYFITRLREFDRDNIPQRIIDRIRREYTSDAEFTPANAAKASSAAEGLCKWVRAMDQYDKVAKVVTPKRAALAESEAAYQAVMEGLHAKQAELKELLDKLAVLEGQLQASMAQKDRLEAEVELCTVKLDRAQKLISGLGGEKHRWTDAAAALGDRLKTLTGDMFVSAAAIAYLGAFTATYRDATLQSWVKSCDAGDIRTSARFTLSVALGDPVRTRQWVIAGLPNDSVSIDNAIMMSNARRWPLMIDPQKQANKWIKNMEEENRLLVLKLSDGDYMRQLENAVQFGTPVLLENIGEELDPSLEPLLLRQVFKSGGSMCIKLGDNVVEYSADFKMYMTTALRNPHYLPETAVKVTLLNFMITQAGLSDQLLGVAVAQEMPELEERRAALVVTSAANKAKLKEIEDRILGVLSSSQGNILEDATAVQILSEAKQVSNDIQQKEVIAEETQRKIDAARLGYRTCGEYSAVLFFAIADLQGIDGMYQYSLRWFIAMFVRSITESAPSPVLATRLQSINDHFTYALYCNVCRSLFEKDKLQFAFLLTTCVLKYQNELSEEDYSFLLTGGGAQPVDHRLAQANPDPSWVTPKMWDDVLRLSTHSPSFSTLPAAINLSKDAWRKICDEPNPHRLDFPTPFDHKPEFERLLLLKCLRPDKLVPATERFVAAVLGTRFVEPPAFDLAACFAESGMATPLLFVLSPGTDPTALLLKFAEDQGAKLQVISMGQGQGTKAANLLEDARQLGTWVLLQNCHLAPSWMPTLERICESVTEDNTDASFRLWMTSMPSAAFPAAILQSAVKMTNEPPSGMKANMRRCLALDPISNPQFWESSSNPSVFKKLLFGLCFVHAFVQERRKFGAIGWNIPYGFDDGDLRISARQLLMYINDAHATDGAAAVPFEALRYAIGECNYGGRVTDDKDRRLLTTLVCKIFSDAVLEPRCALSESGVYVVPDDGAQAVYLQYIDQLPSTQQPEVFGLHQNADISKDLNQTEEMLQALLASGGRSGGTASSSGHGGTAAVVSELLAKLPANFDIESVQAKYPVSYSQSMNQVLSQEMLRYNRLLVVIRSTLQGLDRALQGLQVLSGELEGVLSNIELGRVPSAWRAQSYPSLKPLAGYVTDLLARLAMLQAWADHGPPAVFWLSGFFFTPSFSTAVMQNFARQHKLPIDGVTFDFEVQTKTLRDLTAPPADGAYIHGLFLEGCGWDAQTHRLCESRPKVLYEAAPVIWLRPLRLAELRKAPAYDCPVYRTPDRRGVLATTGHSTNFLMMLRMPTDQPQAFWTLRGVCMLCSLAE